MCKHATQCIESTDFQSPCGSEGGALVPIYFADPDF